MSEFFEAIWHGEGIGDGGDLEEALQVCWVHGEELQSEIVSAIEGIADLTWINRLAEAMA